MKKKQIPMNKLVYLGLSILEMSKTVTNEFCYDHVKPTYGEKKSKIKLHGYRHLYNLRKNRRHLRRS